MKHTPARITRYRTHPAPLPARSYLAALVLPLLVVGAMVAAVTLAKASPDHRPHTVATEQAAVEVCFPRDAWDAHYSGRPCYTLSRPYEDGSGYLYVGTITYDRARCVIPNVQEERGHFTVKCHRIPVVD